jgi:hypothetical protein
VLPDVGSRIVCPGRMSPRSSASSMSERRHAVLDRAGRVRRLELGPDPDGRLGRQPLELDERRVADGLHEVGVAPAAGAGLQRRDGHGRSVAQQGSQTVRLGPMPARDRRRRALTPVLALLLLLGAAAPGTAGAATPAKTVRVFAMGPEARPGLAGQPRRLPRQELRALRPPRPRHGSRGGPGGSRRRGREPPRPDGPGPPRPDRPGPRDLAGGRRPVRGAHGAAGRGRTRLGLARGRDRVPPGTYAPQIGFYARAHPELAERVPQTRLLASR